MRRLGLLAALIAALIFLNAAPALADGIDFSSSNQGGHVSYNGTGGNVTGSDIPITQVAFGSTPGMPVFGENCGSKKNPLSCGQLSFTTGNFLSDSVVNGKIVSETFAGGGHVTLVGQVNGGGLTTLLSATFNGPVTITSLGGGLLQVSGALTIISMDASVQALFPNATLSTSGSLSNLIIQTSFGRQGAFSGKGASPDLFIATPEPSGMLLLGSGLLGLSGMLRRRKNS